MDTTAPPRFLQPPRVQQKHTFHISQDPSIMAQDIFNFSTEVGYFLQDDPSTDPATFDYVSLTPRASKTPTDTLRSHQTSVS